MRGFESHSLLHKITSSVQTCFKLLYFSYIRHILHTKMGLVKFVTKKEREERKKEAKKERRERKKYP